MRHPCAGRSVPVLCRSGVEPPTGMIHPRESNGTTDRRQKSIKGFISRGRLSGFGIVGGYLAGVDRSGRGFNPRPAQDAFPSGAWERQNLKFCGGGGFFFILLLAMIAEELERNIYAAREDARRRGLEFVTVEHLVLALLDNSQVREILNRGADADGLRRALEAFVQNRVPKRKTPGDAPPTEGFKRVIRRAFARPPAQQQGRDATVNGLHILAAVYAERDSVASYYLQKHGVERLGIIAHLSSRAPHTFHSSSPSDGMGGSGMHPHSEPGLNPGLRLAPPGGGRDVELTAAAVSGELESPFGREKEVAQAARALARKYKNNPLLVGEPGVGKTAVVHALAHRIARGQVPEALAGMKIFAVSVSDLVAGAKYRGDFEQRMRDLLEKCRAAGNAAIFIDEIHTVVGAGAAAGGALDAANILKPALSGGGARCIGATTFAEFRRVFERDAALSRRFQPVNISEPGGR